MICFCLLFLLVRSPRGQESRSELPGIPARTERLSEQVRAVIDSAVIVLGGPPELAQTVEWLPNWPMAVLGLEKLI